MSNPIGRPPFEITQEIISKAEAYASRGMTQQQIADALGMPCSTFQLKKNENMDFLEAIKRGKAKGIAMVADALLKNVQNSNVTAQIFYLKCQAGWKETQVVENTGKDGTPLYPNQEKLFDEMNKKIDTLCVDNSKDDNNGDKHS